MLTNDHVHHDYVRQRHEEYLAESRADYYADLVAADHVPGYRMLLNGLSRWVMGLLQRAPRPEPLPAKKSAARAAASE